MSSLDPVSLASSGHRAQQATASHQPFAALAHPSATRTLPVSPLRVADPPTSDHTVSKDSSGVSQQGRVHIGAASGFTLPMVKAESGAAPLPLFQANQAPGAAAARDASTAQSGGAGAAKAATPNGTRGASARLSARGAAVSKRTAEAVGADGTRKQARLTVLDAGTRKQARLTGFAARMSGTSAYRGVSWHTQTSRWKAQIKVAGKDVNLGRHRDEIDAARAYDRAAICARGAKDAKLNFAIDDYAHEATTLSAMPLADLAASLRGVEQRLQAQTSRYHGVRLNKRTQKWEAYIRVAGKHVHLGCYDSEVAAAQAFDQAALVRQAHNLGAMGGKPQLVTNFPPMIYLEFTNQLFQLANPLATAKPVSFNAAGGDNPGYCRLDDKYVQNLLAKCQEQGGSLTAYPSIAS